MLLLETIADSLDRMNAAQLVTYWKQETAAMYDGIAGTIDDASSEATWNRLLTIDPAAFRRWMETPTPYADSHPDNRTPEIMQTIEEEDYNNLCAAYGV